jgi:PadR family transcriptional regulator, regulatory protein PadR
LRAPLCRVPTMRMTEPARLVLLELLRDPGRHRYGLDILREVGLKSGTLYPVLARLEVAGLVDSEWEDVDPTVVGRPQRRMYWLTGDGVAAAEAERHRLSAVLAKVGTVLS